MQLTVAKNFTQLYPPSICRLGNGCRCLQCRGLKLPLGWLSYDIAGRRHPPKPGIFPHSSPQGGLLYRQLQKEENGGIQQPLLMRYLAIGIKRSRQRPVKSKLSMKTSEEIKRSEISAQLSVGNEALLPPAGRVV